MSRPSDPKKLAMWRERFERFSASSGIPVGQFCSRERVSVASFYHWRKKLGPKGRRRRMTDGRGVFQQVTGKRPPEPWGSPASERDLADRVRSGSQSRGRLGVSAPACDPTHPDWQVSMQQATPIAAQSIFSICDRRLSR